jgi:hypothetical protein
MQAEVKRLTALLEGKRRSGFRPMGLRVGGAVMLLLAAGTSIYLMSRPGQRVQSDEVTLTQAKKQVMELQRHLDESQAEVKRITTALAEAKERETAALGQARTASDLTKAAEKRLAAAQQETTRLKQELTRQKSGVLIWTGGNMFSGNYTVTVTAGNPSTGSWARNSEIPGAPYTVRPCDLEERKVKVTVAPSSPDWNSFIFTVDGRGPTRACLMWTVR